MCLNQLNHRGTGILTILGILFSFSRTLILFPLIEFVSTVYRNVCSTLKLLINIEIQLFLPIQSVLSMNINSPIIKLLVSIDQCPIYFYIQFAIWFTIFSIELRKQTCIRVRLHETRRELKLVWDFTWRIQVTWSSLWCKCQFGQFVQHEISNSSEFSM